jgi:uncharacterized membrane protein YkvA (DUF1232 family)
VGGATARRLLEPTTQAVPSFGEMTWVRWLFVAAAVVALSWLLLILLARRLPNGLLSELAEFLPACLTAARRLARDQGVPRRAKVAVAVAAVWVISPIDLIPEFLPVVGPLDDIVVVALALRYAARRVPRSVLDEAWTGDRRLLDRLLGQESAGSPTPED